ncbi:hypothetical protein [Paracoccus pacificus]|uniref:Peptidase propeptide and YPEB domain-containing protein n=1 Tax=Paracoccus pacificus TaxID=1463598 RepID=A0ABW4R9F8_9RHOB
MPKLLRHVGTGALIAALALPLPLMAQTAAPDAPAPTQTAPTQTAPAAPAPATPALAAPAPAPSPAPAPADTAAQPVKLPPVLESAGLTNVTSRERDGLTMIRAQLDGKPFGAVLNGDEIVGLRTPPDVALPQALIDAVIPQVVRDQAQVSEFARINGVGVRDGEFGLMGTDSAGESLRVRFSADGKLQNLDRGDKKHGGDDKGWRRGKDDRKESHGKGGDHGDRKKGKDRGPDGRRGHDGGPNGGPNGGPGAGPAAGISVDEARKIVTDAGYTDLGAVGSIARSVLIDAVNPNGENVRVEVGPDGSVIRETAR